MTKMVAHMPMQFALAKENPFTLPYCLHKVVSLPMLMRASRLVHDQYLQSGYIDARPSGIHLFLRDLLSTTDMFVALDRKGQVIGTTTAYRLGLVELPAQSLYPRQIEKLLGEGSSLIESSRFATLRCDISAFRGVGGMSIIGTGLTRLMFEECSRNGPADWIMIINPRVRELYVEGLGFEQIADQVSCPHVKGSPGILLRLRVSDLLEKRRKPTPLARELFFESQISIDGFSERPVFAEKEIENLLLASPNILRDALPSERAAFFDEHPRLSSYAK